jgi:CAAX prenyl protease-like protein
MFSRAARARILPFATYLLFIVLADLLGRAGFTGAQLRWLYPAKIAAVTALLVVFWAHYHELRTPRMPLPAVALAVAAGVVVLVLWLNLDAGWMVLGQSAGYDPSGEGALWWLLVGVRWLGATLVVPVMEELFWRSFLMRWLEAPDFEQVDPATVKWRHIVVTVILFGVEHNLWLAGVAAGLAYSLLYRRQRNLWSPILAHAVTNGLLGVWIICTANWTYW